MIIATVFFDEKTNITKGVEALSKLPTAINPVYYTEDEGKINESNLVSNTEKYAKFKDKNPLGFMLYINKSIYIDVTLGEHDYYKIDLYSEIDLPENLIITFFDVLAEFDPLFGYSCDTDEYDHRNITFKKIGANSINTWVGRDLKKYISGIYWYTLFSARILSLHNISLPSLLSEAVEIRSAANTNTHLLRFFENHKNWKEHSARLDAFCKKTDGFFSKDKIDQNIKNINNYLEYSDAISKWS